MKKIRTRIFLNEIFAGKIIVPEGDHELRKILVKKGTKLTPYHIVYSDFYILNMGFSWIQKSLSLPDFVYNENEGITVFKKTWEFIKPYIKEV